MSSNIVSNYTSHLKNKKSHMLSSYSLRRNFFIWLGFLQPSIFFFFLIIYKLNGRGDHLGYLEWPFCLLLRPKEIIDIFWREEGRRWISMNSLALTFSPLFFFKLICCTQKYIMPNRFVINLLGLSTHMWRRKPLIS